MPAKAAAAPQSNRRIQVRKSGVHGKGVFALQDIADQLKSGHEVAYTAVVTDDAVLVARATDAPPDAKTSTSGPDASQTEQAPAAAPTTSPPTTPAPTSTATSS